LVDCPKFTAWTPSQPRCTTEPNYCSSLQLRRRVDLCTNETERDFYQCFAPNGTSCKTKDLRDGTCVIGFCVLGLPTCVWDAWSDYSPCSSLRADCVGNKTRTRIPIAGEALCLAADATQTESCLMLNGSACSGGYCYRGLCSDSVLSVRDCMWSEWSTWGPQITNSSCQGYSLRNRTVQFPAIGGGSACSGPVAQKLISYINEGKYCYLASQIDGTQFGTCESGVCEPDCNYGCWECWSTWSSCGDNCGSRNRTRATKSRNQGISCGNSNVEYSPCINVGCPGYSIHPQVIINIYPPATGIGFQSIGQPQENNSGTPSQIFPTFTGIIVVVVVSSFLVVALLVVVIVLVVRKCKGSSVPLDFPGSPYSSVGSFKFI